MGFTKDDLRIGYVVVLKGGDKAMVMPYRNLGKMKLALDFETYGQCITLDNYFDDLKHPNNKFNVETVFGYSEYPYSTLNFSTKGRPLIWKREEQNLWNGKTYEQNHREMWNWLADHPDKTKGDWFELQKCKDIIPRSRCFACEIYDQTNKCPLCSDEKCTDRMTGTSCLNGLFAQWWCSKGFERAKCAKRIAVLQWNE